MHDEAMCSHESGDGGLAVLQRGEMALVKVVTCSAPVNIAVIKYWGKKDEQLILPLNPSLSVTLDQGQLKATTTVALSRDYPTDRLWLNGREVLTDSPRLHRCLHEVRQLARQQRPAAAEEDSEGHVHICSVNNFPTAAGLASSAAGYACLVYTLSRVFNVTGDISGIARQGSGSACRSVYGGFVEWVEGEREDGADSIAMQVAPSTHWPELEVLILVVSAEKKPVSSTVGMQTSAQTSELLKHRVASVVPQRMREMEEAILKKDFQSFGRLTMQDSNQFHAVCLDTYPPILYLNDTSRRVIQMVTQLNKACGGIKAAYTFDAGPNAVLFSLSSDLPDLLSLTLHFFPPGPTEVPGGFVRGLSAGVAVKQPDMAIVDQIGTDPCPGALQYIIHTKVGPGPQQLSSGFEESLLNAQGLPRYQH